MPSRGFRRYVVPLSSFPKEVNRADIAILHFFTQKPPNGLTLYLDNITLLQPGESLPEPGNKFALELARLIGGRRWKGGRGPGAERGGSARTRRPDCAADGG